MLHFLAVASHFMWFFSQSAWFFGVPAKADVVATAKRDLQPGETLDGEGGCMVWGKIVPARTSLARRALPLGLAHMKIIRPVAKGQLVTWADVEVDSKDPTVAFRREMEKVFTPPAIA